MNTSGNWKKLEWKGITAFLLITFTLTYAIEAAIILNGISPLIKGLGQYTVAVAMWIPALATILTIKFITREKFDSVNIRVGDWKPYVSVALIIPACFILIYGLSWLFGWGQPDWELQYFRGLFVEAGIEVPPIPSPFVIWPALFFASLIVAPFFNSLLAFGEELGWRGYLLPKLMPLGKRWAYLLIGIIWGLWHLPLVLMGFMYPGNPFAGVVMFLMLTTVFGIYMNELTLRYRSSILAGWIHGVFNTQRLGMWALLFPTINPWLGGFSGILGIGVWLLLGLWVSRLEIKSPALNQQ